MVTKKGYVRLHTSFGDLNLELHCDIVPVTCHNFVKLCNQGYYNDTCMHRSIKNFMVGHIFPDQIVIILFFRSKVEIPRAQGKVVYSLLLIV